MQARSLVGLSALVSSLVLGCGGASPAPAESAADAPEEKASAGAPAEPEPELSPEAAALIAETEGKPATESAPPKKGDDLFAAPGNDSKGHELIYRVSSDGMKIEVLGVTFTPTVKTKKVKGGYGIDIELVAKAKTDVVLASSEVSPIAVAVLKKGKDDILADKKTEGDDLNLVAGRGTLYRRSWPSETGEGLAVGEEAEVQVGLWGLGETAAAKKPVRSFFIITFKVDKKGTATAVISPPKTKK